MNLPIRLHSNSGIAYIYIFIYAELEEMPSQRKCLSFAHFDNMQICCIEVIDTSIGGKPIRQECHSTDCNTNEFCVVTLSRVFSSQSCSSFRGHFWPALSACSMSMTVYEPSSLLVMTTLLSLKSL